MDIKAAATEGQTKATAWLAQNLPVENIAPPVDASPTPVPAADPVKPVDVPPAAVVPAKPGLADEIRRDREARAARTSAQTEATKYKADLEALRRENDQLKALGGASDPFEFLRGRKLTKEQQALWGQAFLYDLKPEVAPQEFRLELYKAEQARKEELRVVEEQRAQAERAVQTERSHLDQYANDLMQHVQSATGSSPESELWFTEDGPNGQPQVNHVVYARSLMATADNLARAAQAAGQQADLSPANVARVLEAEVSKRMQRRDAKRASGAPVDAKQVTPGTPPAQSGTRATDTTTTSAEGLRSGAPLPPAKTDAERVARAAAVLFGTK